MVDRDERRIELAQAVWRVVRRDGLERASVRAIAKESGLSTGSVRHYFASQSELRIFAMQLVIERIDERVGALRPPADPRRAAEAVLSELLPLDGDRQAENEVWLAFAARALVDPALKPLRDEGYDRLRAVCRHWVLQLVSPARAAREVELETDRLFAVLDGLAVHAALRPDHADRGRLLAVLRRHLDALRQPS
jgi:AcrR family transcriptional regulator